MSSPEANGTENNNNKNIIEDKDDVKPNVYSTTTSCRYNIDLQAGSIDRALFTLRHQCISYAIARQHSPFASANAHLLALNTLRGVILRLLRHPHHEPYRSIRVANQLFQERLNQYNACQHFLQLIGFTASHTNTCTSSSSTSSAAAAPPPIASSSSASSAPIASSSSAPIASSSSSSAPIASSSSSAPIASSSSSSAPIASSSSSSAIPTVSASSSSTPSSSSLSAPISASASSSSLSAIPIASSSSSSAPIASSLSAPIASSSSSSSSAIPTASSSSSSTASSSSLSTPSSSSSSSSLSAPIAAASSSAIPTSSSSSSSLSAPIAASSSSSSSNTILHIQASNDDRNALLQRALRILQRHIDTLEYEMKRPHIISTRHHQTQCITSEVKESVPLSNSERDIRVYDSRLAQIPNANLDYNSDNDENEYSKEDIRLLRASIVSMTKRTRQAHTLIPTSYLQRIQSNTKPLHYEMTHIRVRFDEHITIQALFKADERLISLYTFLYSLLAKSPHSTSTQLNDTDSSTAQPFHLVAPLLGRLPVMSPPHSDNPKTLRDLGLVPNALLNIVTDPPLIDSQTILRADIFSARTPPAAFDNDDDDEQQLSPTSITELSGETNASHSSSSSSQVYSNTYRKRVNDNKPSWFKQ